MADDENQDARQVQDCCNTLSNANATLNITVAGVAAGDQLQIVLTNSTNPPTAAGTRRLTLKTSSDPIAATSTAY